MAGNKRGAKARSGTNNVPLTELLNKLSICSSNDEHGQVIDTADAILAQDPSNQVAVRLKAAALIELDRLSEASKLNLDEGSLELLYVRYRQGRLDSSSLKSLGKPSRGLQHIRAQAAYRLGDYNQTKEVYSDLSKGAAQVSNETSDLTVNKIAVDANLATAQDKRPFYNFQSSSSSLKSYEEAFNYACGLLNQRRYVEALDALKEAKLLCQNNEDLSSEDALSELQAILVQAAYAHYCLGQTEQMQSILEDINVTEITDEPLRIVTYMLLLNSTNLKDINPFLALRLLDASAGPGSISEKMLVSQRGIVDYNRIILESLAGSPSVGKWIKEHLKEFPQDLGLGLVVLGDLSTSSSLAKLHKAVANDPTDVASAFALANHQLRNNNINAASSGLQSLFDNLLTSNDKESAFLPGLLGSLIFLRRLQSQDDRALEIFHKAYEYIESPEGSEFQYRDIIRVQFALNAAYSQDKELNQKAIEILEGSETDLESLCALMAAYSTVDSAKAEQLRQKITPVSKLVSNIDIGELDGGVYISPQDSKRKLNSDNQAAQLAEKSRKKVKHRKNKLPKTFDEKKQPDPERWLPLRDRSYYKPKRSKRNKAASQGYTQGDVSTSESVPSAPVVHPTHTNASASRSRKKKSGKR